MKMEYTQQFYVKNNKELYLLDELKKCKICESINKTYKEMSICPECGRIVCQRHVKIDYLDKKTPICNLHAKPLKLWIQTKYFAKKENLSKYNNWWKSQNFLKRVYEDKIIFGLMLLVLVF